MPVVVLNDTPVGSVPVSAKLDVGKPLAVTAKVPRVPTVNTVFAGLMMAGASSTTIVKICPSPTPTLLIGVNVTENVPPVPGSGVPLKTPIELKPKPLGSVPASLNIGAGKPLATRAKLPADPATKVAVLELVIAGASSTISMNV